jgi:hypothetical protein
MEQQILLGALQSGKPILNRLRSTRAQKEIR